MKTILIISAAIFVLAFTSCDNDEVLDDAVMSSVEKSMTIDGECEDCTFTTTVEDLTDVDIEGLKLMREEELVAHDVYVYFYEKYGTTVFTRISSSESKHAEAVLALLDHFGMQDPATGVAGSYNNPELQALYDELIAAGDESVEAALAVGALIEETDILDLQELIDGTTNIDIETVYANLLSGSYNHLKAFTNSLSSMGVDYVPQLLPSGEYEEILASASSGNGNKQNKEGESGNQNKGRSSGEGNGQGENSGQKNGTQAGQGDGSGSNGNSGSGNQNKGENKGQGEGNKSGQSQGQTEAGDGTCDMEQ
ncbi:MAG TPA: DUF2202 domain-containing protein [Prolixibacteraceae bacterium]|nr:DUF2202 domain-containing protein [Prolixibacteraceae bacterium]